MNHILIDIDVFYRDLVVCFGDTEILRKCIEYYHNTEKADYVLEFIVGTEEGKTIYSEKEGIFLLWMPHIPKTAQDYAFLSHEVFHASCAVMEKIGGSLSETSEEVYAYLITFITQKIIEGFFISFSCCGQEPETEPNLQPSLPSRESLDS